MILRNLRAKGRLVLVTGCAIVAGTLTGVAIAQESPDSLTEADQASLATIADTNSYIDSLWQDTATRAENGELTAEVDQDRAAGILQAAINPPDDPEAAQQLEDQMIALTEKLRESGDLPSLADESRFDGVVPRGNEQ